MRGSPYNPIEESEGSRAGASALLEYNGNPTA